MASNTRKIDPNVGVFDYSNQIKSRTLKVYMYLTDITSAWIDGDGITVTFFDGKNMIFELPKQTQYDFSAFMLNKKQEGYYLQNMSGTITIDLKKKETPTLEKTILNEQNEHNYVRNNYKVLQERIIASITSNPELFAFFTNITTKYDDETGQISLKCIGACTLTSTYQGDKKFFEQCFYADVAQFSQIAKHLPPYLANRRWNTKDQTIFLFPEGAHVNEMHCGDKKQFQRRGEGFTFSWRLSQHLEDDKEFRSLVRDGLEEMNDFKMGIEFYDGPKPEMDLDSDTYVWIDTTTGEYTFNLQRYDAMEDELLTRINQMLLIDCNKQDTHIGDEDQLWRGEKLEKKKKPSNTSIQTMQITPLNI